MASDPNAPIVIGNLRGRGTPNDGAELTTSLYDLDTLTRPVTYVTGEEWRYIPRRFAQDSEYPKMFFVESRVRYTQGLLTVADLVYLGRAKEAAVPNVGDTYQTRFLSVAVQIPSGEAIISLDVSVQFRAPTTNWSWITDRKPGVKPPAQYSKVRSSQNPFAIDSNPRYTARNTGTGLIEDMSAGAIAAILKPYAVEIVDTYNVQPIVPDRYWRCSTTVSRTLSTNDIIFIPKQIS